MEQENGPECYSQSSHNAWDGHSHPPSPVPTVPEILQSVVDNVLEERPDLRAAYQPPCSNEPIVSIEEDHIDIYNPFDLHRNERVTPMEDSPRLHRHQKL